MRCVVCPEWGPPEVLVVEEREPLAPSEGRVVVDVGAAGANYVDGLIVGGQYQIKIPAPFTPGSELAGTVSAVGDGVTGLAVGDRVVAMPGFGAFAEQVSLAAEQAVVIPDELDLPRAATFIQSYCTAVFAFTRRTRVEPGEWVLVLGAGGGVGLAAIDVARSLGARVIAAASTEAKRQAAVAQGAEATIDTSSEDVKTRARELAEGRLAVVIDPVGGDLAEPALRALAVGGRFVVIGFAGGSIPRVPLNQVLLNNRDVVGIDWGAWSMRNPDDQRVLLVEALELVRAGRLHPVAPTTYPLEQAGPALADLLGRRVVGKVALVP